MKSLLTGLALGAALVVSTASAMADGMPAPRRAAPPVAAGCFNFNGFYIGAHGAWNYYTNHRNDRDGFLIDNAGWTEADDNIGGGLQVGYNIQAPGKCTVLGIEADWSWSKLETDTGQRIAAAGFDWGHRSSIDWIATLRTRGGIVVDNMLFYVTGGFAFADVDTRIRRIVPAGGVSETHSISDTQTGFVFGVGTEVALSSNLFLKSEVLYMNFGAWDSTIVGNPANFGPVFNSFRWSGSDEVWSSRIGINYRF